MKVGYETIVSYWPETVLKRSDFAYLDKVIQEEQREMFQVPNAPEEVRRINDKDGAEILGERVARKALDTAGLKPSDIDCIIAENEGGKYIIPGVGCAVHQRLDFPQYMPVFDIRQGGASFVDASHLAWCLLLSGQYKRILVVTVAASSVGGLDKTSPLSMTISDGAAAAIVSSQNLKCEFLSYSTRTDSFIYDQCFVALRPAEHPELLNEGESEMGIYLAITPEFFEYQQRVAKNYVRDLVEKAVDKANLALSDLNVILAHQASMLLMEGWMEGMEEVGVDRGKWKETFSKYGGALNADFPANLAELWEEGGLKKGSVVALFGPGGGGHTSSLILRWLD